MYTYKFMKSVRVIPVSAVLSRVPYGYVFLHMARNRGLHTVAGRWPLLLSMAPPQLLDEKPESAERARSRLSRVASHVLPAGLATSAKHAATAAADGGLLPSTEVCDDDSEPIQMSERECFMFDLHGFLIVREFLTPGEYTFCCLLCVAA